MARVLKYSKTCLKLQLKIRQKYVFKTDHRLMQIKSIAECLEHSAILSTFIKLPFVIKIFVLSIYERPLKTSFTVLHTASVIIIAVHSREGTKKALIRLRGCAGLSVPL